MEKGGSLPGSWLQAVSPRDGALGTWERPSHRLPGKHVAPEITEAGRGSCGSETGGWLHRGNRAAAKSVTRTFQNSESVLETRGAST